MMKGIIVLLSAVAMVTGYAYNQDMLNELDSEVTKKESATPVGDIRSISLNAHNMVRKNHVETPPLTWDDGLANGALSYALELANTGKFEHSKTQTYLGENLFKGQGNVEKNFDIAAYFWYGEIKDYDFKRSYLYDAYGAGGLGHFTQMVWATTKKVGCAGAKINAGRTITTVYVCRYSPAGNVPGGFNKYVRPVIDQSKVPISPLDYEVTCVDKIPAYCANVPVENCASAQFGKWNREQCPKTCNTC